MNKSEKFTKVQVGREDDDLDVKSITEKGSVKFLTELCTKGVKKLKLEENIQFLVERIAKEKDSGGLGIIKELTRNPETPEAVLGFLGEKCLEDVNLYKKLEETTYITETYGWRAFEDVLRNLAKNSTTPKDTLRSIANTNLEGNGVAVREIKQAAMENIDRPV